MHLLHDALAADNAFKECLKIAGRILCSLVVGIKVLCFQYGVGSDTFSSNALLLSHLGVIEQNVDLTRVAKVGSVSHAT